MTDTNMLRNFIKASGYKITFLAEQCGITYPAFLSRLKGEIEFRVDEVRILKKYLNLTDDEVALIFYT